MPDEFGFDNLDNLLEPIDKGKNKEEMASKLKDSFANGTPFIDYCEEYVFLLAPTGGNEWIEYSFIREDGQLTKEKRDLETAFHVIKEEIIRGLSEVAPDLNVNQVNDIAAKSNNNPRTFVDAVINELDPKIPIVRSVNDLQKAIDIVQSS